MVQTPHSRPFIGICTDWYKGFFPPKNTWSILRVGRLLPANFYLYSPRHINWHTRRVQGYTVAAKGSKGALVRHNFPLPKVVYNRISTRRLEGSTAFRAMVHRFHQLGIKMFNPRFFNKAEIHHCLSLNSYLSHHLPRTYTGFSPQILAIALSRYPAIFVKRRHGSLGVGVVKVVKANSGYYLCYRVGRQNKARLASNLKQLYSRLLPLVGRGAIVQQAISLSRYHGRVFDIRVLMQRNAQGKWVQTHSFAKVAAPGSVASNVAAGGSVVNANTALQHAFPQLQRRQHLKQQLHQVCQRIMQQLSSRFTYLGEAGIDIGIDGSGRVWIIEVNAKYSRHVFPRNIRFLSIQRPLTYALRLARR